MDELSRGRGFNSRSGDCVFYGVQKSYMLTSELDGMLSKAKN